MQNRNQPNCADSSNSVPISLPSFRHQQLLSKRRIDLPTFFLAILFGFLLGWPGISDARQADAGKTGNGRLKLPSQADPDLTKWLSEKTSNAPAPGFWAAVYQHGQLKLAAVGLRKHGSEEKATIHDHVHIGSCTKAMTSTLAARLVESGSLKWDSTVKEILPRLSKKIHPSFQQATLKQLLSHRSGVPANAKNWWLDYKKPVGGVRKKIAIDSLQKPAGQTGDYLYSNLGYMVAGLMIEKIQKKTWEKSIQEELFNPLGMKSAGFGPPGRRGKVDQPWGHQLGSSPRPIQHDNAPALGPAGTVHLSLKDWIQFAKLHLETKSEFLKPETIQQLHQPYIKKGEPYAMGWGVSWDSQTLSHSGSNTFWYATLRIEKKTNAIYIVVANMADPKSSKIVPRLISELRNKYR